MEQLTLMDQYNKSQRIEESVADHLLNSMKNVKFLRTRLFYSDLNEDSKDTVLQSADEALYYMASLAFFITRYYGKYRYKSMEYFKELVKPNKMITITDPVSMGDLKDHHRRAIEDLNGLFRGHKRYFDQYSTSTSKIIGFLQNISQYLHE